MNDTVGEGRDDLSGRVSDDMLEDMFNRLIDGRLAAADEARLDAILAENDAALARYCRWMHLHAALHWEYPAAAVVGPLPASSGHLPAAGKKRAADDEPADGSGTGSTWAAIGLLVLVGGWFTFLQLAPDRSPAAVIADVVSVDEAATWSGFGGLREARLVAGDPLAAGCIRLEGATALAKVRFVDGTVIEVIGDSVVDFEDDGQKRIVLRKGSMLVDAQPQSPGRPMVVRTTTAELEVMGTEFSLSTDADSTRLGVTEGRVRFKRMVDGSQVEVPANGRATASFTTNVPLQVEGPAAVPESFRETFTRPRRGPDELGEWLAAGDGLPARMSAVPYLAGRTARGTPIIHRGISIHAEQAGFVAFHSDSVVRLTLRTAIPAPIDCMLVIWGPSGAFGGNFLATVDSRDHEPRRDRDDGWSTIEIPASAMRPTCQGFDALPNGARVARVFVNSIDKDVQLEVEEVALCRP